MIRRKIALFGALSIGTVAFLPGTASASSTEAPTPNQNASFVAAQKALETQVTDRISTLESLSSRISSSSTLTPADRANLGSIVGNASSGDLGAMNALLATVESDTTSAELAADRKVMIDTYRIYAVVAPQVCITIAADKISYITGLITAIEPNLDNLVIANGNTSTDVTAYNQVLSNVSTASSDVSGIDGQLKSLTPAAYNSNPTGTHSQVQSMWQTIKNDFGLLGGARSDIKTISGVG